MTKHVVIAALCVLVLLACSGCGGGDAASMEMRGARGDVVHYGAGGSLPGKCTDCSVN